MVVDITWVRFCCLWLVVGLMMRFDDVLGTFQLNSFLDPKGRGVPV